MMATAMAVCVVMILGLLALIVAQGISSFWPRPVERVTFTSGEVLLGVPVRAKETPDGTTQHLFRVGNRDLGQTPFRWVDEDSIERRERPEGAVFVERQEWGVFLGELAPDPETGETPAWSEFEDAIEAGAERRERIKDLRGGALARANRALSENRQAVASANLRLESGPREGLPVAVWIVVLAAGIGGLACVAVPTMRRPGVLAVMVPAACLMLLLGWLERPGDKAESLRAWHEQRIAELAEERESIEARFASLNDELAELEAEDSAYRVRIMAADGTVAPESQSATDRPMKASQVIRAFPPNALNAGEKAAVFLGRHLPGDHRDGHGDAAADSRGCSAGGACRAVHL
jgi:ABC-type phosphate transport system auxiliary subunit